MGGRPNTKWLSVGLQPGAPDSLGLAEGVCDLEGLSAAGLVETMERTWSARAAIGEALPGRVEALAAEARRGVAAICDLLGEGRGGRV